MKKRFLSLLLAALTILSLIPAATADGGYMNQSWTGEVISRQVSLYKEPNSGSGSTRKVQNGTEFFIQEL